VRGTSRAIVSTDHLNVMLVDTRRIVAGGYT
jgi:hypothetical protein